MNNRASIMIVAGTRPELIKLSPIINYLNKLNVDYTFIWSGQHYDYAMSKIFFEQLGLNEPDENLNVGSGTHSEQTAKIIVKLERIIKKYEPGLVVALGDTNTVMAASLAATKNFVPFAHVEAGLRSWDREMPEEINRIVADSIADFHFTPTELATINLMHEGIPLKKIYLTGNTIVDVVLRYKEKAIKESRTITELLHIRPFDYILLTLHRQENTDNPEKLTNIIKAIMEISKTNLIVFPVHPRTIKKLKYYDLYKALESNRNIFLVEPLGYFHFLGLLAQAKVVLTDSGGVQEEACVLNVPTLTLRYNTERPETILLGINKLVGNKPDIIVKETMKVINSRDKIIEKTSKKPNPFGKGNAGEKIANILRNRIEQYSKTKKTDEQFISHAIYLLRNKNDELVNELSYEIINLYTNKGRSTISLDKAEWIVIKLFNKDNGNKEN